MSRGGWEVEIVEQLKLAIKPGWIWRLIWWEVANWWFDQATRAEEIEKGLGGYRQGSIFDGLSGQMKQDQCLMSQAIKVDDALAAIKPSRDNNGKIIGWRDSTRQNHRARQPSKNKQVKRIEVAIRWWQRENKVVGRNATEICRRHWLREPLWQQEDQSKQDKRMIPKGEWSNIK